MGETQLDSEDIHKTAASTFRPKSLRNKAQEKMERMRREMDEQRQREAARKNYTEPVSPFQVSLKPTGINENASHSKRTNVGASSGKTKFVSLKKTTVGPRKAGKAKKTT